MAPAERPADAGITFLVLLLATLLAGCPWRRQEATAPPGDAPAVEPPVAAAGPTVKPPPSPEESRVMQLEPGEMLRFEVEQQGIDLALFLEDPAGRRRIEVDSPNGGQGLEWIDWIAEAPGRHRVVLRRLAGSGGFVVTRFERLRPSPSDRRRAAATRETAAGLADWRAGRATAQQRFATAAILWAAISDSAGQQLTTLQRWAAAAQHNGDSETALEALGAAHELARKSQAVWLVAQISNLRAKILCSQGHYDDGVEAASEALVAAREAGSESDLAIGYASLGLAYQGRSDYDDALASYQSAEEAFSRLGQPRSIGVMRFNIGTLLLDTSRWAEGADALRESLALLDPRADRKTVGQARGALALALFQMGDADWREPMASAVSLLREVGDPLTLTRSLDRWASLSGESGDFEAAEQSFAEVLRLHESLNDPHGLAFTRANRAWMELRRNRPAAALEDLDAALPVFYRLGIVSGQAYALLARAEAERRLSGPVPALATASKAIELVEGQRLKLAEPISRMVYLDPRLHFFDTFVEVAMEMQLQDPGKGYAAEALEKTEKGRARGLLDLLKARYGSARQRVDPVAPFDPRRLPELVALREAGTTFLVFYCSRHRAYLWSLGDRGLRSFDLGPIAPIEKNVRAVYSALSGEKPLGRGERNRQLAELSAQLLPAEALAGAERVVVVGDGAIRYIPFALLPHPVGGRPLVSTCEVAYLPSLSVLAALRALPPRPQSPGHHLAVVADPLFFPSGRRLRGAVARAIENLGLGQVEPLPYSRLEAERLLSMAPAGERLALLGTSARRDWILRGFLAPYRFVHFATHGLFDPQDVRSSGLVLAQLDSEGRDLEPFLSFGDIEKIRLEAELVVASACETAMGRDLRGEGPVGVSQAFLAAGARRTVGSLWRIRDRETADFMAVFYRFLLVEKLAPAAALRRAQLHFLELDPQLRSPHWAAYVLLGEYL